MIEASPEQLSSLQPLERLSFRVADVVARRMKPLSIAWNSTFMVALLWSGISRRMHLIGIEHLRALDRQDRVILVCNHRSFFDFFAVSSVWFRETSLSRRMFFPVRANFFYDNPVGIVVNAVMSGFAMFPPIFRERRKIRFNLYALERCVAELAVPGTTLGIHPEGTRNKSDDPYTLLPPQPGVGKVAIEAEGVKVIPIFTLGLNNRIPREIWRNLTCPEDHPVYMLFGPPIDLSDLRAQGSDHSTQKEATERCMAAIQALAEVQREMAKSNTNSPSLVA